MFVHSVACMKLLRHPNVVTLHEVIDDENCNKLYLVIDYVKGGPLMDDCGARLVPSLARSYFRDILNGLEYLHFQNVIHQDLKPENLLVDER